MQRERRPRLLGGGRRADGSGVAVRVVLGAQVLEEPGQFDHVRPQPLHFPHQVDAGAYRSRPRDGLTRSTAVTGGLFQPRR